ncbi:MAG: DUF4214 domain-containing protein [Clostridia bacterium]|nr:DUF4214 domain-containing protein [Clostridia bacterium]
MKKGIIKFCSMATCAVMLCSSTVVGASTLGEHRVSVNYEYIYSDATGRMYNDEEEVGGFVARLYRIALGREYETEGFLGWCDKLAEHEADGASVARGFILSDEFKAAEHTDEDYVNILYRVFFDREPDDYASDWVDKLENGTSREEVLSGFIESPEWTNVCDSFGILSGNSTQAAVPEENVEENDDEDDSDSDNSSVENGETAEIDDGIKVFVRGLYTDCLGREADEVCFNEWCSKLANHETTGKEIAYCFFFSPEFTEMTLSLSKEEVIAKFYKVFLNREPDSAGMEHWLTEIKWGNDVKILFKGFSDSEEFANKCESYGIVCGDSIELPDEEVNIDEDFLTFAGYSRNQQGLETISGAEYVYRDYFAVINCQSSGAAQETHYLSSSEKKILENFANEHFNPDWSDGQKALYTLYWINRNVTYGNANGDYCESIFIHKTGQCAQYNGALLSMLTYLGMDVSMIRGYRGYPDNKWSHFWGEIYIGGEVYVMECGNYNQSGDWSYFCQPYSNTTKFIKFDTPCS